MSTSTDHASTTETAQNGEKNSSTLFGRGLLYVVVWSLQLVASSVISPVLAHLMPQDQFGQFATAIALFQALSAIATFGLDQAIVLQNAEDGNPRRARSLIAVTMLLASAVTVLGLLSVPLWANAAGFTGDTTLVVATLLWVGPGAIVQVVLALLVAQDRFKTFAGISLLSAIGGSVVGLVLILTVRDDAAVYAIGGVICQVIAMVIAIIVGRPRFTGLRDLPMIRRALALGVPVAVGNLAYFVLNAGDRFVVQAELGPTEVARYQVAYVVGSAVILLLTFTNQAWGPQFAAVRDAVARRALALHSRDLLYLLLGPVVLAVTLVSPIALPILAPASYRPASLLPVVFVVALTAFPVVAAGATQRLLVVERRGVVVGVITVVAAAANIGANLLLVPIMGILGAAVATVVSYAILASLQVVALRDRAEWHGPRRRVMIEVLPAVAVAAASILVPQDLSWNIVRGLIVLACIPWFFLRLRAARSSTVPGQEAAVELPAPRRIVEVDLDEPLPDLVAVDGYTIAHVVGFRDRAPVGAVDVLLTDDPADARRQLDPLTQRHPVLRPSVPDHDLPAISVVVSTVAARMETLELLIDRLTALDYPRYEVIIVDNRATVPVDDELPALLDGTGIRLVAERRPGLSAGRNAGVAAARSDIIAFTDDDVQVDPGWLRAFGQRFARQPELDALSGIVLPSELDTPSQVWVESYYGGMGGVRNFEPLTLRPGSGIVGRSCLAISNDHGDVVRRAPIYGIGGYAAGASMAVRASALQRVGGFDTALGAGSPAKGGEDLQIMAEVLWTGGVAGFEPHAVVHHRHRREFEELTDQMYGYGVGAIAFLVALIVRDPRHLIALAVLAPASFTAKIRQMLGRLAGHGGAEDVSIATAVAPPAPPAELAAHELRGFKDGLGAYFRARKRWRQVLRDAQ